MTMKTRFEQLFDQHALGLADMGNMNDVFTLASQERLRPAAEDEQRILFVAIDMQNDFMENGALPVPGSFQDAANAARFIYRHMDRITDIAISLDTHQPQQIFHPCWWTDESGNHPEPYTIIKAADVADGKWIAAAHPGESLEYVTELEAGSRKDLCIWPYHCLEGTVGAALETQFAKVVYFHSIARRSETQRIVKGLDPLSEMYGIIKPEYDRKGSYNRTFLERLPSYDKVIVAGEAKSHCVMESVRQILEHYGDRRDVTSKIVLLADCMSPIPGFEQATDETFASFQEKYGIHIVNSTELEL